MIRAMIFDLDGTLVQTERLKARSYAQAAAKLCPQAIDEANVVDAYKEVVGRSRKEVATALMKRFDLEDAARQRMAEFDVSRPWQAYVQVRLQIYHDMLSDVEVLRENRWPHNVALLRTAREHCSKVGLATMSSCSQTQDVLRALKLRDQFDFVASVDDVEQGKPHPDLYLLVADELDVSPQDCLVVEDSPSGVKAGVAAGMQVVAVSTPFTKKRLHEKEWGDQVHIVDGALEDVHKLSRTVTQIVQAAREDESH